jgi:hypothetical protein
MAAKDKRLEALRQKSLDDINQQRLGFDEMIQRAEHAGEAPDEVFVRKVLARSTEIDQLARAQGITGDELKSLLGQAKHQNWFKAFVCPQRELEDEGCLLIDEMEEWNVPKTVIARLRASLGKKIQVLAQILAPRAARC